MAKGELFELPHGWTATQPTVEYRGDECLFTFYLTPPWPDYRERLDNGDCEE